jgi:hypothetical protein
MRRWCSPRASRTGRASSRSAIAVILPFVRVGRARRFPEDVAITAGPLVASQTGFSAWQREVIAFAYQFGSLILPTVGPAIVWVITHRRMFERLRSASP